ncbi:reverse transcriptase domain-containing protein [Tanacetum coccineum]
MTNLRNEISNFEQRFGESFHEAWDRYKDLLRACPHHGFTELHQLDTFYNALNPTDQDSLNSAVGGNLLERSTRDVLMIIENKSKVRNSQKKSIVSQVKSSDVNSSSSSDLAKLTHAINQQTSAVTTTMTAILKQFQATPPPAFVKSVEEICVTCAAAGNYNQDNSGYRPPGVANQTRPPGLAQPNVWFVLDGPSVPMPPLFINPKEDEHVEETLTDPKLAEYTIKVPPPLIQKAKPTSQKNYVLENTSLNENCSAVILKKLLEKLGDPGKFLIPCGFSELKCKALADLGASINLTPLSVWKKLGLLELISTRMTLVLANRAIYTPARIERDNFVLVGKFTFPADFVIVDYESDPRVPLILGRPFLQTARALIDVHGEEMILHDGDKRLILNMRHDTLSYSNKPQKESINMIDIYNVSHKDYLEDYLPFDIESDLREIEYLLNNDPTKEMDSILEDSVDKGNLADDLVDTIPEMFTDEHTLDYSSPPLYDDVDDDLVELESDNDDVYDDPFDSKEDKIKESKLLIDELDPPRSSDFLPSPKCDSVLYEDFSKVDALPSTNNEDKDFNPPLYELPFHKEVPGSETLLSFSSENEEKVFNPGILTSKGVHTSLLLELSHRGPKAFKVIKIFESPMEIFPCSYGEDIHSPEFGPSTALKMTVPSTVEEKICKKNDVKARSLLLMALANEHQLTFDQYVDAQSMFAAIKDRFGGNEATKKT